MVDFCFLYAVFHKICESEVTVFIHYFTIICLLSEKLTYNRSSKPKHLRNQHLSASMLVFNTCRLNCWILGYNLRVMAAHECLPQGISSSVQNDYNWCTACWINLTSFELCLWSKSKCANGLMIYAQRRAEKYEPLNRTMWLNVISQSNIVSV